MRIPRISTLSIDWPNHIIGFFSALFGILIAFELDQWRERKQEEEIAQNAFTKLKQEIQINRNTLHEMASTNREMLALLKSHALPNLNDNLQFTGTRLQADSLNNNKNLMTVFYVDTTLWEPKINPPAHVVLGNLIQPVLQVSAWESAKTTGALNFMDYEKVLTLSSLYNAPRITDELLQIKTLVRSADQIKNKSQLAMLLEDLKKSHILIFKELEQYDLFVSMVDQME
jgi:hypothetical protein